MESSPARSSSQPGGTDRKPSSVASSSATTKDAQKELSTKSVKARRQNSLRRVKDSTDVLRERSLRRQRSAREAASEGSAGKREGKGRQFTVANVGNNGMIYLRPLQKAQLQPLPHLSFSENVAHTHPPNQPMASNLDPRARDSVWTQASTSVRNGIGGFAPLSGPRTRRSFSQSTIDDRTPHQRLDNGTLKIIIDRTETAHKTEGQPTEAYPSIEVPIPHYRLGTPRFSAKGTAFLHQSVYTRSSVNGEGSERNVSPFLTEDRLFPNTPGVEAHAVLSRRHSQASPQPYSIQTPLPDPNHTRSKFNVQAEASTSHPLSPQIYDQLAASPDDPTIVKYSPINGDIIAATPARIIAQITSENFLDYELLSDFFLTVRAYISTHDLLHLLLARFEWAINRFDDNGRVIRVRAFAALRHWILNYFSYDFVIDRELRVQFCDRINSLTRLVRGRAGYGTSDLKLIADLKKCWNGRCSLFWDSLPLVGDSHQDIDIQPGGVVGSRDSQLVHQSQLRFQPVAPQIGVNPAQITAGSTSIANWYSAVMEHGERQAYGHHRQTSAATSKSLPISPSSEHSVPILSCSIPSKGFKRASPYANKALGAHPIPAISMGRRACPAAPSSWSNEPARPIENHRRSGSFSDATRDRRAPLSSEIPGAVEDYVQDASLSDRSLLRGHCFAPGGPYVSAVASTPAAEIANLGVGSHQSALSDQQLSRRHGSSHGPAVKNLIGNIRRALSSKHPGIGPAFAQSGSANATPSQQFPSLGKSASVPLNVMFQATSSGQLESYRSVRVDLLAAEIFDSFRQATTGRDPEEGPPRQNMVGTAVPNGARDRSLPPSSGISRLENHGDRLQPPELRRLNSSMTDSSQSILIVDDTGLNIPGVHSLVMAPPTNIGSPAAADEIGATTPRAGSLAAPRQSAEIPSSASFQRSQPPKHSLESAAMATHRGPHASRQEELTRRHSHRHTRSASTSLRRYASYQSTFTKRSGTQSIEVTSAHPVDGAAISGAANAPARMLRRRPGGDLRANQNVQDLETPARPKSTGSVTTYADSVRGSEALGFGEKIARTFNTRKPSREKSEPPLELSEAILHKNQSLVRTHSSQPEKRRPSFEAAVAQFAHIPDDGEGGIEATLLKLEGRYRSPVQSPTPQTFPDDVSSGGVAKNLGSGTEHRINSYYHADDLPANALHGIDAGSSENAGQQQGDVLSDEPRGHLVSTLYAGSDDSYNSVPLLERGTDEGSVGDQVKDQHFRGSRSFIAEDRVSSGEIIQETQSMRRLRHGSVAPTATTDSFLLDENDEFMSDTSSELSMETVEAEQNIPQPRTDHEDMILVGQHHPPSPPTTMDNVTSINTQTEKFKQQQKPPTPDPSPISRHAEPNVDQQKSPVRVPAHPRHMPFILGCDSELLAQQFTIVEQDALKEVDWRDLVDMRWQNTATSTTNWVEYLLTQDPLGIDLVTARFNIMVKWALSEVVLTENIEERALTIMKYIHIAQQSRKLSNYATLLQLTIALTSADCTRLSKTWDLVPDKEKDILQDLEMLVSPRRNFHNLRVEMEKANADQGCIPVVALYVHDLTYNAQKPPQLPGVSNGEPLINFERYRSTAVIVKNLLRLIDASTKYDFQPVEGVIERCLWMACLTDEMITHTSKEQEYGST